jgi:hypothetical protein
LGSVACLAADFNKPCAIRESLGYKFTGLLASNKVVRTYKEVLKVLVPQRTLGREHTDNNSGLPCLHNGGDDGFNAARVDENSVKTFRNGLLNTGYFYCRLVFACEYTHFKAELGCQSLEFPPGESLGFVGHSLSNESRPGWSAGGLLPAGCKSKAAYKKQNQQ